MKTRSYIHMMHIAKEVFAKVQAFCQSSAAPPSLEGRVEWLQWAVHLVVNHKCELFDRNPSLLVSQQQEQAFEEIFQDRILETLKQAILPLRDQINSLATRS